MGTEPSGAGTRGLKRASGVKGSKEWKSVSTIRGAILGTLERAGYTIPPSFDARPIYNFHAGLEGPELEGYQKGIQQVYA